MNAVTAMQSRTTAALAPLVQRWHTLESRQKRIVATLALLAAVALALAFAWLPAMRAHDRLLARLPELNTQLSTMQRQAGEVRALSAQPTNAATVPPLADAAALQALFGAGAKVSVDANRGFRVAMPKIAYAAWWDQLDEAQARYALSIVSLSMTRVEDGNREVSVEFTLADRARAATPPAAAAAKP